MNINNSKSDFRKSLEHNLFEDTFAMLTGTLFISLGITLFNQVGLLTGGTAGFAFLIHYSTKIPFGILFSIINLPFYILAFKKMGWRFTLKTFCAISLVSLFSNLHSDYIQLGMISPFYIATIGGLLMGVGFIVLFRHEASLGGINILSLYLQNHYHIRAGKVQMAIDIIVILASFFIVDIRLILASITGVTIMNLCIIINHKPGRYTTINTKLNDS